MGIYKITNKDNNQQSEETATKFKKKILTSYSPDRELVARLYKELEKKNQTPKEQIRQ